VGRDTNPAIMWVAPMNKVLGAFNEGDEIETVFKATGKNLTAPITYELHVGSLPDGISFDETSGLMSGIFTDQVGLFDIIIRAQSGGTFLDHPFRLITGPHPSPVWITPSEILDFGNVNETANTAVEAVDPYELPVQYSVVGGQLPSGVFLDPNTGAITGTYPNLDDDREYDFTLAASNGDTAVFRDFSIYVAAVPPEFASIWVTPAGSIGSGYELSFFESTVLAIDPRDDHITYVRVAGNIPPGLQLDANTGLMSGTLDAQPDDTEFKMILGARNSVYTTKRLFLITVKHDVAPSFEIPGGDTGHPFPIGQFIEGFSMRFTPNVTSNPELPISYTAVGLPDNVGIDVNNGMVSSDSLPLVPEPRNSDETVQFSITASDGLKSASHQFVFVILRDLPPVWQPVGNSLGQDFGGTVFASPLPLAVDVYARPVVYTLSDQTPLPDGLTFDPDQGEISGNLPPTPDDDIDIPLTITAVSGVNPAIKDWTITAWHNIPAIWDTDAGSLGIIIENTNSSVSVAAHDFHGEQAVTYAMANATVLPPGLTLIANSGAIVGTTQSISDPNLETTVFTIEASFNGLLPTTRDFSISVQKNYPPVWDTPAGSLLSVLAQQDFGVSVVGHDPNGSPLIYAIIDTNIPDIPDIVTTPTDVTGRFPPTTVDQTFFYKVSISDGVNLPIERDFTLTSLANLPPVWVTNAGTILDAFEHTDVSIQLDAFDPEGADIEFYITPNTNDIYKEGNTVYLTMSNTGLVTGTLPHVDSDTTISFTAIAWDQTGERGNNRYLATSQSFDIVVRFNTPPTWNTAADIEGLERTAFSLTFSASGAGNLPQIVYTLKSGSFPTGLTMDANGVLSGILPAVSSDQDFIFTMTADNGIKQSDRTFTFTVVENVPPVWDTPAGEFISHLGQIPFSAQIIGHDDNSPLGNPVTYTLTDVGNVPVTVSFTAANPITANSNITGVMSGHLPLVENSDALYTFTAALNDGLAPPVSRTFTIRNLADRDPLWGTPAGSIGVGTENKPFTFTLGATDPEANTVVYALANGTNLPDGLTLSSSGFISGTMPPAASDTDYPFSVFASDGTHESFRDFTVTVQHDFPPVWVTPAGSLGTILGGFSSSFRIEATDQNPHDTVTYSVVSGSLPPGLALLDTGFINGAMDTIPADEDYNFTAQATDGTNPITRAFAISGVRNQPPVFVPGGSRLARQKEQTNFTAFIDVFDPDGGDIAERKVTGLPDGLTFNTSTFNIEGVLPAVTEDKTYSFDYLANDGIVANTQTYTIDVLFSSPPVFQGSSTLNRAVEGQIYAGDQITALSNGSTVFYSVSGGEMPDGINLASNGQVTGVAPGIDTDTNFIFDVTASTGIKSSVRTYTLSVIKNQPPVWDSNATISPFAQEGQHISYSLVAHDINGQNLTYTFQSGAIPSGWIYNATSNGVTISGTGQDLTSLANDAVYTFTIGASNGFIRTDRLFTIVVHYNSPPIWGGNSVVANVVEQTAVVTSVHATDPEGNAVTYAANTATFGFPSWLTLNANSGQLSGTVPPVLSNSSVPFTIAASDGNRSANRDFSINIIHNVSKVDPFANAVSLIMHMENFNDFATLPPRTFSVTSPAALSSAQFLFGSKSLFANGGAITTPSTTDTLLANSEWTVEFWAFPTSTGTQRVLNSNGPTNFWNVNIASGNWVFNATNSGGTIIGGGLTLGAIVLNQWQHVAITRGTDGVIRGFVNGVVAGATISGAVSSSGGSGLFSIGGDSNDSVFSTVFMDEVRITQKQRYTATFTPVTNPFPNPPLWLTANATLIASGPENSVVTAPTPVVAYDNDNTGSMSSYTITSTTPFSYGVAGNTGVLNGFFPTLVTDANFPIVTVARDGNGNWTAPRTFFAKSNAATAANMVMSWRFNKDMTSSDFSLSTGNAVVGQPGISGGTATYAQAPAPHGTETAMWTGNTGTGLSWDTGVGHFNFLSGSFTLEMWVYMAGGYPQNVGGGNRALFIITPSAFNSNFRLFRYESSPSPTGNMAMTFMDINRPAGCPTGQDLVPNAWQHVAFTRNATTSTNTLWLNGVAGPSTTTSSPAIGTFDNCNLLINPAASTAYVNVFYHSIIFWNVLKYTSTFTPVWPGY
jgi:hypothetical protein